ncbi:hypothetical protein GCM10010172_35180 [Paractinoplanes ferrugineus]|uniref:Uncharacterized protein n=1 Tax=Paractinoplanes ferrugineus TaxID=113564 RepID=A0A919MQX0_9ACTN|nr:hypothetical protein [Actinoplanes ferrugineus]GIE16772.1 hypothetical protein Afe05nite_86120 [Actinoplanes ferrugineus]
MTIREVHIHRADTTRDPIEPVVIRIEQEIPLPPWGAAEQSAALLTADGNALADAIWESCPGGTIDALLASLFARKASQFRVRFPQEAKS